jgi:hypothetical protein
MFNVGISFHPTWASNRARSDCIYGIGSVDLVLMQR